MPDSELRPYCFDLSILDLYLPLQHGAALVLTGSRIHSGAGEIRRNLIAALPGL